MKKKLFGLLVTVIFSFHGNAQDEIKPGSNAKAEFAYISVKHDNEVIKYKFSSFKDLVENSEKILEEISQKAQSGKENDSVITVEISISFSEGVESNTVTGTTTATCNTIVDVVKKMRDQLIAINME